MNSYKAIIINLTTFLINWQPHFPINELGLFVIDYLISVSCNYIIFLPLNLV